MVLTLLSTFGFSSIAQVAITGKVTNQKDNSAIEGISIAIKGTKKGTNTDNNGNFSLTHNANSVFTITLWALNLPLYATHANIWSFSALSLDRWQQFNIKTLPCQKYYSSIFVHM